MNSTVSVTRESPIWTMHYNEVLDEADIIPPINGFEEMIQLTNDGKLWNFPIDNEQGMLKLSRQGIITSTKNMFE